MTMVGSLLSVSSSKRSGTTVISGKQLAGTGRFDRLLSTLSPPNLPAEKKNIMMNFIKLFNFLLFYLQIQ